MRVSFLDMYKHVKERFTEDPLRILRAIRFSIIYDFELDEEIKDFIFNNVDFSLDNLTFF